MNGEHKSPQWTNDTAKAELSHKLDAVGWALFLVWVGLALLLDVGWGWGLVGVAAIVLGEALWRRIWQLDVGGFWVVLGLMFLAGGLWDLFKVPWPLAPWLIIGCGVAILWGVLRGRYLTRK